MIIRLLIRRCNPHVEVAMPALVNANRELIRRMVANVEASISRVWGCLKRRGMALSQAKKAKRRFPAEPD